MSVPSHLGTDEGFFTMSYFSAKPKDPSGIDNPTATLKVHRESPLVKVFRLPTISNRFILTRADEDMMIPDWYPGDHLIIDSKPGSEAGACCRRISRQRAGGAPPGARQERICC